MIDLTVAPRKICELMDEGRSLDDAIDEASFAGIEVKLWYQVDRVELGWQDSKTGIEPQSLVDDVMGLEFYHKESKTRWFARFSGYDAQTVEVFGQVAQWEV